MNTDIFRQHVLRRIARGHFHTLKKAIPKKKSTTGKAIPAVKERIASCPTKAFFDKAIVRAANIGSESEVTDELRRMRDEGIIHCTNKMWWKR